MAKKSGNSFGTFNQAAVFDPREIKPITTEFSKGSIPDSLYTMDQECSWSRWRRGYELATASVTDTAYEYPFTYSIPLPQGVAQSGTNPPTIPGIFKGFPTTSKEFGMHWSGIRVAGSLRFDNLRNTVVTNPFYWHDAQFNDYENIGQWFDPEFYVVNSIASIESVTEDDDYWYVQLKGDWSVSNPLPPPLYVPIPGVPGGLKAINGEILEDRIVEQGGVPITRNTIDPNTQKRYGYVQAILVDTNPFTGVLTLRKRGSVEATPDRALVTPATRPPTVGRFFMTGTRYCCSCQDFNRRDFAYMSSLGKREGRSNRSFPVNSIATVKPGRREIITLDGLLNNSAMTPGNVNRDMAIQSPAVEYNVPPTVTPTSTTVPGTTRDNPGIYRDFGSVYLRGTDPALPGAKSDGPVTYEDYSTSNEELVSLTDTWTPILDEFRYCKHIYAMRFKEGVFPPEPSDLPLDGEGFVEWEQNLVRQNEKNQERIRVELSRHALSYMDVPPYNCQSPMMMPMMQKLFNVPSSFIKMQGFQMFDKDGNLYNPSQGGRPAV
jgi:hypothetical protein